MDLAPHRPLYRRLQRRLRDFTRRYWTGAGEAPAVAEVGAARLSYAEPSALYDLHRTVQRLDRQGIPGVLVEAGCALGGSAIVIARAKQPARAFEVYDVFGMPPPPSEGDGPDVRARYAEVAAGSSAGIEGEVYYGYRGDLLPQVQANFEAHGVDLARDRVTLVRGLVQDTLVGNAPVAFAHIDCDRHASVLTCLERLAPRLARGGVLVIDDYEAWSGCRKAVHEYFDPHRGAFSFTWKSRLHVERLDGVP